MEKQECRHVCKFMKKEKLKYHIDISIQTLYSVLSWSTLTSITASSLLGYYKTSWIWGFSAILLCRSSQALPDWIGNVSGQPAIFSSPQRCLIHGVVPKPLLHCLWLSCHSVINPRSVECCSDGWPSGSFSQELRSSARVPIKFLVTSLKTSFLIAQFNLAALGRVIVGPNFSCLRIMEATVLLGTFNAILSLGSTGCWPLTSLLVFCNDMYCQLWDLV